MPEKRSTFSDLESQELAKHLRKPNGEKGKKSRSTNEQRKQIHLYELIQSIGSLQKRRDS